MKTLLIILSCMALSMSAPGQTQGVSQRATNGVAFGDTIVQNHIRATNSASTNTFIGKFQQGTGTTANGTGASSFGLGTRSSGSYSFSSGIGSINVGAGSVASGTSNNITSSAPNSLATGNKNFAVDPATFVAGASNTVAGSNSFVSGFRIVMESLSPNSFIAGQNIDVTSGASNNFAWNSDPTTTLVIPDTRSNAFTVTAPGGIFLNGPVTFPASGVSVYASNVISGGVLPAGTVSASTATAGYVLASDGTSRQWTNRVSLAQIDGIGGTGLTNLVTGGIVSTNGNIANTRLILNGAQNGALGSVIDYSTNNVSVFSVNSSGTVASGSIASGGSITASVGSITSGGNMGGGSAGLIFWASRSLMYSPADGFQSFTANNSSTGTKLILGGASTAASLPASTNWPTLSPASKTNGLGYAELSLMAGTNLNEFASFKANQLYSTNVTGNTLILTNGNVHASGYVSPTNGVLWQGGSQLTNIYTATATLDFGNVATIGCADLTIAVTGAALGDVVDLGVPNASIVANSSFSAWVSATDTVTVRFCALISGDPASGVFRAEVHKWK